MVGGEEVATRMTAGIGILGVGGVTLVVVATETGTVIEGLAVGQRLRLVAARLKMAAIMEVTVVAPVVAMAATITPPQMDRVILVVHQTRGALVTKASKGPLSSVACRGLLRMA